MRKRLFITLCLLTSLWASGQTSRNRFIGINVLQLPALTINANYSNESKPFLTPTVDIGYAFNYEKSFDFIGNLLTPHCDCENGYKIDKRTGGYLKFGTYFNLRKSIEKQNFFHLGIFLINSLVYESGVYDSLNQFETVFQPISHTIFVPGISLSGGYEFAVFKKLKSNIDFQISFPNKNYKDLYGYRNFIPGMGYKDIVEKWFPMLIWNLKYRL